jgi:hypothetical protein
MSHDTAHEHRLRDVDALLRTVADDDRATNPEKELASRGGDGINVSLYWHERTNRITVKVYDARLDEAFELDVDGRDALDAYRHPFAYAAGAVSHGGDE